MPSSSSRKHPRILFVTPEVFPLCKTGGLGDVSAALPAALHELKVDIRLLLPGYPAVLAGLKSRRSVAKFDLQPHFPPATLLSARLQMNESANVLVYVIHCPELYQREGGIYLDNDGHDWLETMPGVLAYCQKSARCSPAMPARLPGSRM